MREWQRIGGVILVALACATAPLLGVDGPLTVAPNLRVRTDTGSGYLLVTAGAYSGADGPYTNFGNIKLRTDQNGYLLVSGTGLTGTISGSSAVGDVLLGTGGTSFGRLADVATGQVLASGGVGVAPAWTDSPILLLAQTDFIRGDTTNGVQLQIGSATKWQVDNLTPFEFYPNTTNAFDLGISSKTIRTGYFGTSVNIVGVAFGSLGTPANGTITYCTDCTETTAATCPVTQASCVCTNGGNGAFARRVNATWYCTF